MESVITAIPAALNKALGKRRFNFYSLAGAVAVQGILKGYSLANIRWIIAQAALESDWGASNGATQHNAYFGMMVPSSREYVASGTYENADGQALAYKSAWQCAKDRFMWDEDFTQSVLPHKAGSRYPKAVSSIYHGSASYEGAVTNLATLHKPEIQRAVLITLLVLPLEAYAIAKITT